MENWRHTLYCVYLYGYFLNRLSGVYCDVIEGPLNIAGILGERIVLTCTIGGDQQIWRDNYSGASANTISSDDNIIGLYQGIYKIEGIRRSYSLVLIDGAYARSGTHTCEDLFAADKADAEIIVLESNTVCTTNSTNVGDILIEGEYVYYMCNVRYKGLWGPKMTWSSNIGVGINPDDESDDRQEIKLLQHSFTTIVTSNNDDQSLGVVTSFDPPVSLPANSATNAPDYIYTWNSPAITVHYPPRDIVLQHCTDSTCDTISDVVVTINPNDRIQASAAANPNIDYFIWKNGTNVIQEGDKDEYTFTVLGISTIDCSARNTMRDGLQGRSTRTIQVMVVPTTTLPSDTESTSTISSSPISTSTQPLPCKCEIDGRSNGLGPGGVTGVAIGCIIIGALIPIFVFAIFKRQDEHSDEKPQLTNPIAATNPANTTTEHTQLQTRGEYEHMNISPYINTRPDRPENNVYADLTREDTPYEQV